MTEVVDERAGRGLLGRATTIAAATALALGGALAATIGPAAALPAAAAVPADQCPAEGEMPGIGNEPTFTDGNVAVFVGGDYLATGTSAESEGLLLVRGDATFDKTSGGLFNVGAVGVGSGITPAPGATMLAVGGNLTIDDATRVEVGANIDGGGAVRVGGTITPGGGLTANGAVIDDGLGADTATAPFSGFRSTIAETSADLAARAATGTAERSGARIVLTGSGDSSLESFEISAADLNGATEVFIDGVADGAALAITVTGGPVEFSPTYFSLAGERVDDFASPEFGNAASRLLWNMADAASVTLGGTSQFMGSVLAPAADAEITASTNGRVYVGGNLTTRGTGNEQHNYPWIGAPETRCTAETAEVGGFSLTKEVVGEGAGLVPEESVFTVEYTYVVDGDPVSGSVAVPGDGTVVAGPQGLPAGTAVSLVEVRLPEVDGVEWGQPEFSPSSVTVAAGETTAVTLTNTADLAGTTGGGGESEEPADDETPGPVDPGTDDEDVRPQDVEDGEAGGPVTPEVGAQDAPVETTGGATGSLPVTGSQAAVVAAVAVALLAAGAWLVVMARRRAHGTRV